MTIAKTEAYYRMDEPFRRWMAEIDPLRTEIGGAEQEWKEILQRILLQ